MKPLINIVGASVRAAAFSAVRAGYSPSTCDLFGDADLRAVAHFEELPNGSYPDGLVEALQRMPEAPVLYTGALERHPGIVERLGLLRPLLGNTVASLRDARDPFRLAEVLRDAGVEPPALSSGTDPPDPLDGWLRKPIAGGGGAKIEPATESDLSPSQAESFYFQEVCRGTPCSSVHVAREDSCVLLGVTRQLVGQDWLHAPRFAWCGSIGPRTLSPRTEASIAAAGLAATRAFGLRGLFGLDFLLDGDAVHPVELNPRYTASVEILEHALGVPALALHAAAFRESRPLPEPAPRESSEKDTGGSIPSKPAVHGKAVLFAPEPWIATSDLARLFPPAPFSFPLLADLPSSNTEIGAGKPALTVFSRGRDEDACLAGLRRGVQDATRHFRKGGVFFFPAPGR